jgi:beta-galactosidase
MRNCDRLVLALVCFFAYQASAQIASLPATFRLVSMNGVIVPFQNGIPSPSYELQRRPILDLAGTWKKQRFAATGSITLGLRDQAGIAALSTEAAGRQLVGYNDSAWPTKTLPAIENTLNGFNVKPETYEDGVWYRRTFTVPDTLQARTAVLKFLAANYVADVWLNGTYLGYHEGGYTPFSFDVSGVIRYDTINVIAVRIDNPSWGSRNDIVPYGTVNHKPDWFNYTGIIHDVYLEFPKTTSVARAEAIPQGIDGTVTINGVLWNSGLTSQNVRFAFDIFEARIDSANASTEVTANLVGTKVLSRDTSLVAVPADSSAAVSLTLTVPSPKLWSPKHPNLYILRASTIVGSDTLDQLYTQFGIRTVATKANALLLNGKPMYFPGLARHEDHYLYGRSVPKNIIFTDLQKAVDLNATFIRTAHYPNHPYTYLVADRLGLAVMEEIPVWWFDENDAWVKQDLLRHIHEQMWREMVFRDRNRPSILFWSTCNECLDQTNRQAYILRLNNELDTQYPDGRLVTESAAADRPGPMDPTQAACDVAGWTMYFGIFHGSTYYGGTKWFLQVAQLAYPSKPLLDTEFGYWSTENLAEVQTQNRVFDSTFKAFNEFVAVDSNGAYHPERSLATTTWWCLFDWYTCQTGNQTMGLYQMDHSSIKPVATRLKNAYAPFKLHSETAVLEVKDEKTTIPDKIALMQNFPNPFNPKTVISCQLPVASEVRLVVYDLLGREVMILANERLNAGVHNITVDGSKLASGVYVYRLKTEGFVESKKMMLLK